MSTCNLLDLQNARISTGYYAQKSPQSLTYPCVRVYKVEPPKTNIDRITNTMYHMHTLGASKCMHVVHSVGFAITVGFGWFYLIGHSQLHIRYTVYVFSVLYTICEGA